MQTTPAEIIRHKLCDFTDLMRNRVVVGEFRYGTPGEWSMYKQTGDEFAWRLIAKFIDFLWTRNAECLVDVAVYAALLFNHDDHRHTHFEAWDQSNEEIMKLMAASRPVAKTIIAMIERARSI